MILSATGHRPDKLGGYSDEAFERLRSVAKEAIHKLAPSQVISGMALGWDQAVAMASIDLGVPFQAAVPFVGQESMWPESSRRKYADILAKAAKVVVVCEGGYAPWKMMDRNKWMVDNSSHVLVLWNGTPGGTANCVKYAEKVGKPMTNVWEKYVDTRDSGCIIPMDSM